jgi:ribosome-associated heat shock protein Hsp15
MAETRRIDQWLWFARLAKTRTRAASLVAQGAVRINRARIAKPSHPVCPGDKLVFTLGDRVRVLTVLAVGKRRGPAAEAAALYDELPPASPSNSPGP